MQVRRSGLDDILLVHQLAHQIWPQAYASILCPQQINYMLAQMYSQPAIEHQIQNLQHQFYIILLYGNPIGFASFSMQNQLNHKLAKLHKLYVLPQQQHKGAGRLLLNFIIEEAKKSGAGFIALNVNRHNQSALNFYFKNDFITIKEEDIDIGSGYFMNDYVMQKKL